MQALVGQDPEPSHKVPAPVQPPLPQGVQGNARVRRVQLGRTSLVLCPHLTLEVTAAQRESYVFWIIPCAFFFHQAVGILTAIGRSREPCSVMGESAFCITLQFVWQIYQREPVDGGEMEKGEESYVMRGRKVQGLLFTESNLIRKRVPFFLLSFLPSNFSKS